MKFKLVINIKKSESKEVSNSNQLSMQFSMLIVINVEILTIELSMTFGPYMKSNGIW